MSILYSAIYLSTPFRICHFFPHPCFWRDTYPIQRSIVRFSSRKFANRWDSCTSIHTNTWRFWTITGIFNCRYIFTKRMNKWFIRSVTTTRVFVANVNWCGVRLLVPWTRIRTVAPWFDHSLDAVCTACNTNANRRDVVTTETFWVWSWHVDVNG